MTKPLEYGWVHAGTLGRKYNITLKRVSLITKESAIPRRKIYGRVAIEIRGWNVLMAQIGWPLMLDPAIVLVAEEES